MFDSSNEFENRRKLRVMELAEFINSTVVSRGPAHTFAAGSVPGQRNRWFMNGYSMLIQNKNSKIILSIMNCGRSLITGRDPRSSEVVIQQEFDQSRPWVDCVASLRERLRNEYIDFYTGAFRECREQIVKYNTSFPWWIKLLYKLRLDWRPKVYKPRKLWMSGIITFKYKFLALWGGEYYKVSCERQLDPWRKEQGQFPYLLCQTNSGIYGKNTDIKAPMLNIFNALYTL